MPSSKPLILDNGIYVSVAARLAQDVEVAYFSNEGNAFPRSAETAPGSGIPNVERIEDPISFMLEGKASHVIIPDLYLTDYDHLARKLGIPTFSSGDGTSIELDRWELMEFLVQHELPVIKVTEIIGIDALGRFLADPGNADKYVKVSVYRGDLESYHHVKWSSTEPWFDDLKHRLGPWGAKLRFIVQDPIDAEWEVGIDTYVRSGVYMMPSVVGVESKDAAYFGAVVKKIPKAFEPVLAPFLPYFAQRGYNNFFSNEMRITRDRTVYFTDATCRPPWPPSGVMMAACRNFPQVALGSAAPDYGDALYLCEIILKSDWVGEHWLQVNYPRALERNYAFHRFCMMDGKAWIIPHDSKFVEFGSALGWGKTPDAAKEMCREAAESIEGYQVIYDNEALDKAEESLKSFSGK